MSPLSGDPLPLILKSQTPLFPKLLGTKELSTCDWGRDLRAIGGAPLRRGYVRLGALTDSLRPIAWPVGGHVRPVDFEEKAQQVPLELPIPSPIA